MTVREQIVAMAEAFAAAARRRDAAACAELYSENAFKIGPAGLVLAGRAAILADFQALFETNELNITRIDIKDCKQSKAMGFAILLIKTTQEQFHVMLGVELQSDGTWLIAEEMIGA